ncbi:hypothetical protein ACMD2_18920 [Ananas comosus]|uniref:Reverse transcriptase domain-containing protein n=1 Tax=Ananas comosus TaxID=4615 RepID=A0A199UME6_ANACO|nr:hypothetical protein ACMD2_18920 [Ananas comosus]
MDSSVKLCYKEGMFIGKKAEIILVEALKLDNVKPGIYDLRCLPLRLRGAEGSPISLARLTENARNNNLILSIGPSPNCQTTLIQCADDTIFFSEPRKFIMRNLQFLWKFFKWAFGLRINKDKLELYYLGSDPRKGDRLANILGCKVGKLSFRYLGLPLYNKHLRKEDWDVVINCIEVRIDGWKAKLLSQGDRLTLVNSVLTNLPLFYLSIFKAPHWVLHRIEALRRAFF